MKQNYKFHAIAIAIICIVITLLYLLIGPSKPPAPVDPTLQGDRFIEIYSATWGENCNYDIKQAIIANQNAPVLKDDKGEIIPRPTLTPVVPNNVLSQVSDLCNGKLSCEVSPTSTALGVEPLIACSKKLELSYRCYSYDRLWPISAPQGKSFKIDCHEPEKSTAK